MLELFRDGREYTSRALREACGEGAARVLRRLAELGLTDAVVRVRVWSEGKMHRVIRAGPDYPGLEPKADPAPEPRQAKVHRPEPVKGFPKKSWGKGK